MKFRRYYVPNSIIFITQVVQGRAPVFRDEAHLALLRSTLREVKRLHPFPMLGYAFLPDHLHLLIKPTAESTFSQIMHSLKPNFTKEYKRSIGVEGAMRFWQKRFWDHIIRDELDLERHLDYIHYNPVRHGLAGKPEDWPHSSFAEWKRRGVYGDGWGWTLPATLSEWESPELE